MEKGDFKDYDEARELLLKSGSVKSAVENRHS
jgi:hypothetical protein